MLKAAQALAITSASCMASMLFVMHAAASRPALHPETRREAANHAFVLLSLSFATAAAGTCCLRLAADAAADA